MYTLFLDTHDEEITIALFKDDNLLDKNVTVSNRHHSDYTMPMLKELLDRNNLTVHSLNSILVVNGPGSFTGVRLGVTIAKTLAYTLNIPIKTITTMDLYAVSSDLSTKLVCVDDLKGSFIAYYKDNKLVDEYKYLSKDELTKFISDNDLSDKIVENKIDFNKVFEYAKTLETTNAHAVNPIYIKVIEALK